MSEYDFMCPETDESCEFANYCFSHKLLLDRTGIIDENDLFMIEGRIEQGAYEALIDAYCSEERLRILGELASKNSLNIRTDTAIARVAEHIRRRRSLFR